MQKLGRLTSVTGSPPSMGGPTLPPCDLPNLGTLVFTEDVTTSLTFLLGKHL